jgi:hypothetical protein
MAVEALFRRHCFAACSPLLPQIMNSSSRQSFTLNSVSKPYDPRLYAIRGDLADIALAGRVFVPHYAVPKTMVCILPSQMLKHAADHDAESGSQLLYGETFEVVDITGQWAWGFCTHDHYVGFLPIAALKDKGEERTHVVTTIGLAMPFGARLTAQEAADLGEGSTNKPFTDPVAIAEMLLDTPYVWGGRTSTGIDCSGLVQISLALTGTSIVRDTYQQQNGVGKALSEDAPLQRGDIIYFPGHVGMMVDSGNLIHATRYHNKTVIEPLDTVKARVARKNNTNTPILARRRIV